MADRSACTCAGHPQTSLAPGQFDARRICLTHLDVQAAQDSVVGIDASEFRATRLSVEHAVALFFAVREPSPRSRQTYATHARRLTAYHGGRVLAEITAVDLRVDLRRIKEEVVAGASRSASNIDGTGAVASYVGFVRLLFKELASMLPAETGNPGLALDKPTRKRAGRREHYSSTQMAAIFTSVTGHLEGALYTLMLYLVRMTGIRRASLVGLNLEDIDFATGRTLVRGKGGYVYPVYISDVVRRQIIALHQAHRGLSDDEMAAVLRAAVHARARGSNPTTAQLPGSYNVETGVGGTPALWTRRGNPITRRTAERLINAVRANLPDGTVKRFDLHSLRHTWISQVRNNFGDAAAAGVAGHRSNKTSTGNATGVYTLFRDSKHRAIMAWAFGPTHRFGSGPTAEEGPQ